MKLLKTIFLFTQKKYDDENIAEIFVKKLKKITKDIYKNVYVKDKDAIYTDPAKLDFKNASHCYICKEEFDQKIYEKKKYLIITTSLVNIVARLMMDAIKNVKTKITSSYISQSSRI